MPTPKKTLLIQYLQKRLHGLILGSIGLIDNLH